MQSVLPFPGTERGDHGIAPADEGQQRVPVTRVANDRADRGTLGDPPLGADESANLMPPQQQLVENEHSRATGGSQQRDEHVCTLPMHQERHTGSRERQAATPS